MKQASALSEDDETEHAIDDGLQKLAVYQDIRAMARMSSAPPTSSGPPCREIASVPGAVCAPEMVASCATFPAKRQQSLSRLAVAVSVRLVVAVVSQVIGLFDEELLEGQCRQWPCCSPDRYIWLTRSCRESGGSSVRVGRGRQARPAASRFAPRSISAFVGAAQRERVQVADAGFGVRRGLADDPRGQGFRRAAHERVVEEEEGLRGDDRLAALGDDQARVGAVEQPAEVGRVRPGPRGHQVKRPPRDGQVREGRPAASRVQAAGHGQQAVADRFRVQTPAVHPPEQAVVRVAGQRSRRRRCCSAGRRPRA